MYCGPDDLLINGDSDELDSNRLSQGCEASASISVV